MGAPPLLLLVVKHSNWKRSVSGYGSSEFLGSVAGPCPHTAVSQESTEQPWGQRGPHRAQGQNTHRPRPQRRGRFRSLGGPEPPGLRAGPHPSVSFGLGRSKRTVPTNPGSLRQVSGTWHFRGHCSGGGEDFHRGRTGRWVLRE